MVFGKGKWRSFASVSPPTRLCHAQEFFMERPHPSWWCRVPRPSCCVKIEIAAWGSVSYNSHACLISQGLLLTYCKLRSVESCVILKRINPNRKLVSVWVWGDVCVCGFPAGKKWKYTCLKQWWVKYSLNWYCWDFVSLLWPGHDHVIFSLSLFRLSSSGLNSFAAWNFLMHCKKNWQKTPTNKPKP